MEALADHPVHVVTEESHLRTFHAH
jgi:hypothetical protein